jgi:LysR family transcriptional regulator, low CO2-responsive transcriptional regulator
MWNVTLRQLKVFEAVGRHLSFSRAAEELHLTQPAVSMQVRQLEETVGSPLTEQIGKKIFLTAAGAELARHARLIAQQLRDAEAALDALAGLRTGRLNIGFVSTTKYFAAHLLAVFRRRYPELELRLAVHNREQIVQQLADNQIDLAVMGRPPQDVATEAETFAEHPLTMIAAAEHPLCQKTLVEPADLVGETFLIREQGSGTRAAMELFFTEAGIEPHAWLEMTGNETIKQSVMANMGIAFLSEHAVGLEMSVGRLCRLQMRGLPVMRRWYVVHLKEKRLSPVACAFRDFLLSEGAGLIAAAVGEGAGSLQAPPPA